MIAALVAIAAGMVSVTADTELCTVAVTYTVTVAAAAASVRNMSESCLMFCTEVSAHPCGHACHAVYRNGRCTASGEFGRLHSHIGNSNFSTCYQQAHLGSQGPAQAQWTLCTPHLGCRPLLASGRGHHQTSRLVLM